MDDLRHVIGAYFYEFWDEHEYTSWEHAIDDLMARSPERSARVAAQIDALLHDSDSEEMVQGSLDAMGLAYAPPDGVSSWLAAVRDRIIRAGG